MWCVVFLCFIVMCVYKILQVSRRSVVYYFFCARICVCIITVDI